MTPLQVFTRRSARVEAMRLDTQDDLRNAARWLHAHGLAASVAFGKLTADDQHGVRLTARVGQWVTYAPATGEFTVWDGARFGTEHHGAEEVA